MAPSLRRTAPQRGEAVVDLGAPANSTLQERTAALRAAQNEWSGTDACGYTVGTEHPSTMRETHMPLNEHEQKILDEIERQLYEDDPKLAEMVARAVRTGRNRWKMRLAAILFVAGAVIMFASFTVSWVIAGMGFLLMVATAGWMALTARAARIGSGGGTSDLFDRLQKRLRRDG